MKIKRNWIVALLALGCIGAIFVSTSFSAEDPLTKDIQGSVETFADGCKEEITSYCADVAPGDGRVLACLYAHQDKVSTRCEYAVYSALRQLEKTINGLVYAVGLCEDDLQTHCSDIAPGEGRLLECLSSNEDKVSKKCNQALTDIGYKK